MSFRAPQGIWFFAPRQLLAQRFRASRHLLFFPSPALVFPAESPAAQPKTLLAGYNERLNVCVRIT